MGIVRSSSLLLVLAACSDAPTEQPGTPPLSPVIKAQQGTEIYRTVSNGAYASLSWFEDDSYGFLSLWCDDTRGTAQLYYNLVDLPAWVPVESGWGRVPCDVMSGSGTARLVLRVNTASANFDRWSGNGGEIELLWTKVDGNSVRTTGSTEARYGLMSVHSSGTSVRSLARVTGTMFGHPLGSTVRGEIGTDHLVNVSISRMP